MRKHIQLRYDVRSNVQITPATHEVAKLPSVTNELISC